MNADYLSKHFAAMGARFRVNVIPVYSWRESNYAVDIKRDRRGEFFELRLPANQADRFDATIAQAEPRDRHLLLFVRQAGPVNRLDRFLCGQDERHWFVAAVPGGASSVAQAMEALKPDLVRLAEARVRVSARKRKARKNRAFRRQGEWFFIPAPAMSVDESLVLHDESIRRGFGMPHCVEHLYRTGGEKVYWSPEHPNGLTEAQYGALIRREPAKARLPWRVMRRNMDVFARGEISHMDHRTITLSGWHRVLMNTETQTEVMRHLAFLD